jgi:hypothetical protein
VVDSKQRGKYGWLMNDDEREEFKAWLEAQKGRIRVVCGAHHRTMGKIHRADGLESQLRAGCKPRTLAPLDCEEGRVNVFLWTEGCAYNAIFAFYDADIGEPPLETHFHNGKPYRTMDMRVLQRLEEGRFCFANIDDFEARFRW